MTYLYSGTVNAFYPELELGLYENAGTLPGDLIKVSDAIFDEFQPFTNGDKIRKSGDDGLPCWGDRPAQTENDAVIIKSSRIEVANSVIAPLNDAVDLDMATKEEITKLKAWKTYRVLLTRVDTSMAPDIEWPEAPTH